MKSQLYTTGFSTQAEANFNFLFKGTATFRAEVPHLFLVMSVLTPNAFIPSLTEEDVLDSSKSSPSSSSPVTPHLACLLRFLSHSFKLLDVPSPFHVSTNTFQSCAGSKQTEASQSCSPLKLLRCPQPSYSHTKETGSAFCSHW